MLTLQNRQFIERFVTDRHGRQFKLVFAVATIDGQLRAQLVSAEEIKALGGRVSNKKEVFCLPCASSSLKSPVSNLYFSANIVSPFIELFFFTSQPTRAPSYN